MKVEYFLAQIEFVGGDEKKIGKRIASNDCMFDMQTC